MQRSNRLQQQRLFNRLLEEPAGFDPETGESVALGELLAGEHEDPSTAAARNIDWEEFLGSHDHRYTPVVMAAAEGDSMRSLKGVFGVSDSGMSNLKRRLAAEIRESMGDVLADVTRRPHWCGCIAAEHEKAACRAERRR